MFILEPGSRVKKASKNLSIFNPKNCLQALENMIRDVNPGSGSQIGMDPGSGS
jgi:hypothetical protein